MHAQARALYNRIKAQSVAGTGVTDMDRWIIQNTSHPKRPRDKWSFHNHEFQRAIVNCDAPEVSVKKISQAGLSEIYVRLMLGLLSVFPNRTGILTLPTASFAKKFAKTRIDPVVDASEMLRSQISDENNSTELKQLGNSFLYIAGTFGAKAAISVPADFLGHDEVDFSDPEVLSNFASRLGHKEEGEIKLKRNFSTPTVPGFGISKMYDESSQAMYAVRCDRCTRWVTPKFLEDVVLPGFDDSLWTFSAEDLGNPRYRIDETWVQCPQCHQELTLDNLADPAKRQWVHAYPDLARERAGFWVQTLDIPRINPPAQTLRQAREYRNKRDWINFKVGEAYEDAENSFIGAQVDREPGEWVQPGPHAATGCVLGLDVGKTSHLLIGWPEGRKIHVLHAERIRQTSEDALAETVMKRVEQYGVVRGVVDAAPDFTTAMKLVDSAPSGCMWAAQYTRQAPRALSFYTLDEAEQVVKVHRTRSLSEACKLHNAGRITWPDMNEVPEIKHNLNQIKKLARQDTVGETLEYWAKLGPDHYAHALNYLLIAADMAYGGGGPEQTVLAVGVQSVSFAELEPETTIL